MEDGWRESSRPELSAVCRLQRSSDVPWIPPREDVLPLIRALEDGLRERGYGVGQNLVVDHRFADGRPERLPQFMADLVGLNVDVIVVGLNPVAIAARQATLTIPTVTVIATDPINAAGLVKSLARPGGSLTGLSADSRRSKLNAAPRPSGRHYRAGHEPPKTPVVDGLGLWSWMLPPPPAPPPSWCGKVPSSGVS